MRLFLSIFISCIYVFSLFGQATFAKDIAPIIYNKCANCHRPGEIGPFSLTNYDEVKNYGQMIKFVTESKYMPPWKADPTYQHYLEENYLTDDEVSKIANWVDNNMPYGLATDEPSFPDYPVGSTLGTPDLVLNFKQKYNHKGNNRDQYWYFVLPTNLPENKVVKAIELRPGNKKIVHHALFFQDTTGTARSFDEKTAEYGFSANTQGFDTDVVLTREQFPGYVPGQKPIRFPESLGQKLNKNSDLVIQMHYAPTSVAQSDSSSVNIFFADKNEKIERYVKDRIMLPTDLPGGFFGFIIPANQKKTFQGKWKINQNLSILSVFPHMHLLGKRWKVWIEKPDGTIENLIKIDDWDFNWQGGYYFKKFIIAPKNSIVYAEAEYDNTVDNPTNPNSPPKTVSWGENTTDEMYYFPLLYVPYKTGDENVIFDQTTAVEDLSDKITQDRINNISPNPASNELVNISFNLKNANTLTVALYDSKGQFVKYIRENEFYNQGINYTHLDASVLPVGNYYVRIDGKGFTSTEKFVVVR